MIFVTLDTNILIYELEDAWKFRQALDFIEYWVSTKEITLLLPEIIIDEFEANKLGGLETKSKEMKEFFKTAKQVFPKGFIRVYNSETSLKEIRENQLERVESLLKSAKTIKLSNTVKDRVIQGGIQKLAPQQSKTSVADAIIVYSLIEYAKTSKGDKFFFVSNNTNDFCNGKQIHPDLKSDFTKWNIEYFQKLDHLVRYIGNIGLDMPMDRILYNKKRIKSDLQKMIYNPEYRDLVEQGKESFIQNFDTLDKILGHKKPTKEEILFTLSLINKSEEYSFSYYGKLKDDTWFEILKAKGEFSLESYSSFNGHIWPPLIYLKFLSKEINKGRCEYLIEGILNIIENISCPNEEREHTIILIVEILINLPPQSINSKLLELFTFWTVRFHTHYLFNIVVCQLLERFIEAGDKRTFLLFNTFIDSNFEHQVSLLNTNELYEFRYRSISEVIDKYGVELIGKFCDLETLEKALSKIEYNGILTSYRVSLLSYDVFNNSRNNFFKALFRDLLNEFVRTNKKGIDSYLFKLLDGDDLFGNHVALYVISENWDVSHEVFWKWFSPKASIHHYCNTNIQCELNYLFDDIQSKLDSEELKELEKLYNKLTTFKEDYHAVYLMTALKNREPFLHLYKKRVENYGETVFHKESNLLSRGFMPSKTKEELAYLSIEELVEFFGNSNEGNSFGYARLLEELVREEPDMFLNNMFKFKELPMCFINFGIMGLSNARSTGHILDWKLLISFATEVLKDISKGDELTEQELDFCGELSNLITEEFRQKDGNELTSRLDNVKSLISMCLGTVQKAVESTNSNFDYVTKVLNSNKGKVYLSLLNYTTVISRGRNYKELKWNSFSKGAFQSLVEQRDLQMLTILGWHHQNFHFFDRKWFHRTLGEFDRLKDSELCSFMGGLNYSPVVKNIYLYEGLYPAYRSFILRIDNNLDINELAVLRNTVMFYVWEFESINSGLLAMVIESGNKRILEIICSHLNALSNEVKDLDRGDRVILAERINILWEALIEKFGLDSNFNESNLWSLLSRFISFYDSLEVSVYSLLHSTIERINDVNRFEVVLFELNRIRKIDMETEVPKRIGALVSENINYVYFTKEVSKTTIELVEYLFQNSELNYANSICNSLASRGNSLLKEIYLRYN